MNCGQLEINSPTAFAVQGPNNYINLAYAGANTSFSFPYDGSTRGFFFMDLHNGGVPSTLLAKRNIIAISAAHLPPVGGFADLLLNTASSISWAQAAIGGSSDGAGNCVIVDDLSPVYGMLRFTGNLFGATGTTTSFLSDTGVMVANQTTAWQYPVARTLIVRTMSVKCSSNTMVNAVTLALYKNGASTGQTVVIPAGSTSIVTGQVSTFYLTGTDTFDVALLGAASEAGHSLQCAITLGTT